MTSEATAGGPLHRSMDAACVLKIRGGTKIIHIFMKVAEKIMGKKDKLLKHTFQLYSPLTFSKKCIGFEVSAALQQQRISPHLSNSALQV